MEKFKQLDDSPYILATFFQAYLKRMQMSNLCTKMKLLRVEKRFSLVLANS